MREVKRELIVNDTLLSPMIETLTAAARSGKMGDGKILVATIEDVIRIRNGDRGEGRPLMVPRTAGSYGIDA